MWYLDFVYVATLGFLVGVMLSFIMFLCIISFDDSGWDETDTASVLIPTVVALVVSGCLLTFGIPLLIWIVYRIHVKFFKERKR